MSLELYLSLEEIITIKQRAGKIIFDFLFANLSTVKKIILKYNREAWFADN